MCNARSYSPPWYKFVIIASFKTGMMVATSRNCVTLLHHVPTNITVHIHRGLAVMTRKRKWQNTQFSDLHDLVGGKKSVAAFQSLCIVLFPSVSFSVLATETSKGRATNQNNWAKLQVRKKTILYDIQIQQWNCISFCRVQGWRASLLLYKSNQ